MRDVAIMTTIATSAIVVTIVVATVLPVILTEIVLATNSVARPRSGGAAGTLDSALTGLVRATVIMTITGFVAAMEKTTGTSVTLPLLL